MLLYNDTTKEVVKSSAATSSFNKTFVIDHPQDSSKYLVHACLEGPEVGVYYRGKSEITHMTSCVTVYLPEYLDKLAFDFTVQLTPIYSGHVPQSVLCSEEVRDNKFVVHGPCCKFFWEVKGKRKNIETEPSKSMWDISGEGPYTYLVRSSELKNISQK
jgi:hypothetical protein